MSEIWDDVEGWWNQNEVQEARLMFCDQFARMPENPIQELKEALLTTNSSNMPTSLKGNNNEL